MLANFHPISVHFPIAFLFLAGGLYVYHAGKAEAFYFRMAKFLHTLGLGALLISMVSGRMVASEVFVDEISVDSLLSEVVQNHELLGYASIWAFSMTLIWVYLRGKSMTKIESWIFSVIFLIFLILLGYSSSLGAQIAQNA